MTRYVAMINPMVWLGILLGGCAHSQGNGSPKTSLSVDGYFETSRANQTVSDIETELDLGSPIAVTPPSDLDPMWWFRYSRGEESIELSANTETEPSPETALHNRDGFYFASLYYVRTQNCGRPRRVDDRGIPSLTTNIGDKSANINSEVGKYLDQLDIQRPIAISDIERTCKLGTPCNVEHPAFISPMWWVFYKSNGLIVTLAGSGKCDATSIRGQFSTADLVFTGYWSVSKNLDWGAKAPQSQP